MWQSNASIDEWLLRTPNNTLYLFQSYQPTQGDVLTRMLALSSLIVARLETLGDTVYAGQVLSRLYFANETIDVAAPANWLQGLLTSWQSTTNTLTVKGVSDSSEDAVITVLEGLMLSPLVSTPRFDGFWTWCAWPGTGQTGSVRIQCWHMYGPMSHVQARLSLVTAATRCLT